MMTPQFAEVLVAVAVWCGQPVNSTKGAMGFKTGTDTSVEQVTQCRRTLMDCLKPVLDHSEYYVKDQEKSTKCFLDTTYPGTGE